MLKEVGFSTWGGEGGNFLYQHFPTFPTLSKSAKLWRYFVFDVYVILDFESTYLGG